MLEHGAYRLLLDRYYSTEAGIPAAQAYRLARARSTEERQAVDVVLDEFFMLVDGVWINNRAEEEISSAMNRISAAQANGKKGGRPPKKPAGSETETQQKPSGFSPGSETETQQKPSGFSPGSETETQQKAHQSPITNHQVNPSEQPSSHPQPESRATTEGVMIGGDVPDVPTHPGQWLTWFNRTQGTEFDPSSRFHRSNVWQTFTRWVEAGVSTAIVSDGINRAIAEAKSPISNLPAYVEKVLLSDQQARASPPRISHADASKLAAARAIFGTEIEGKPNHEPATNRIIDIAPTPTRALGS